MSALDGRGSSILLLFPQLIWLNLVSVGLLICCQKYVTTLSPLITDHTATGHSKLATVHQAKGTLLDAKPII
jgi:hypothetical protein